MRRGCGCRRGMGADLPDVWKGNPLELILRVAGYWVPDWWVKVGIPNMDAAAKIVGKWAYYLQKGTYPDTTAGRQAASTTIANDMLGAGGIRYSPESVFKLLQNAYSYLQKDAKLPAAQKIRGSILQAANPVTGIKIVAAEVGNRVEDQKADLKKKLGFLASPWAWGLGGLALVTGVSVLSGVQSGIKRRVGG